MILNRRWHKNLQYGRSYLKMWFDYAVYWRRRKLCTSYYIKNRAVPGSFDAVQYEEALSTTEDTYEFSL